jgi:hypothetical protein
VADLLEEIDAMNRTAETWNPDHSDRGPRVTPGSRDFDRAQAIRALTAGNQTVYAARLADGIIKIGCTSDLARRRSMLGVGAEIVAFIDGGFDDERAIHNQLAAHRARGVEYYHPTSEVLAVVNTMRDRFNLPPIAA